MAGRMFLNVVAQFKETTDTRIGVIDSEGTVIACTDLQEIGKKWPQLVQPIHDAGDGCVVLEGKTFKALPGWGGQFDFAAYAEGEDEVSRTACAMAVVALNGAKSYYEEKHDKTSFVKNIISDNILLSDIYIRAKELHVDAEIPRGVFVIRRRDEHADNVTVEAVQNLLSDRQTGIVVSMGESDVVLIQQVDPDAEIRDLEKIAAQIVDALRAGGESTVVIGIGTVANHLRDLAKSYKEAQIAIEVGKVFDTEKFIINYENLGIGRLIYQLPTTLCEMFLQEVFKKNPIDALDKETLFTINKFFENNLILSETARKLFVHRNTLVYRLEKIKKLTGLDLREFDDAITFKVALMVKKYLASRGIEA
ncbi:MAG: helix-turn-helix domain-containing protein [Oscillospiraceae bacterium]|nr:helix-turn-helix domain-containing protein [Oscillospiraceae bacterium]